MLVILTLLLGILQVWWISFIWRDVQDWTFFAYLAFMVLPILLYLAAYLVLPADLHLAGDALAQAFIERRRAFQAIIALVPLASFVQQRLLSGEMPQADLDTLLHVRRIAVAVPGFVSRRNAVQACVALLSLALMLVYICLLFVDLRQAQARPAIARRRLTRSRRRGRSRPRRRAAAQQRRSSSAPDTARRSTAS